MLLPCEFRDLTVILTGSDPQMTQLFELAPKLARVYCWRYRSETLSPTTLRAILEREAQHAGDITLDDEAIAMFETTVKELSEQATSNGRRMLDYVGNGRFSRNVFDIAEEVAYSRIPGADPGQDPVSAPAVKITAEDMRAALNVTLPPKSDLLSATRIVRA
ncbi:stage V sporulation protein K-related protein [Mycobacteroides abscessus subsp. abscessus]|uniref:hypothetical protein n=1 Tax=Mycobacteroides abscessus TaxID=36809 RepID=UPI00092B4A4B|nr:hypothetical protein [Mycobacteroides abscessus]SIH21464.1 stage V sporulation protein K-related protein [Mycobacteroides abscessus subsp. abscessus]